MTMDTHKAKIKAIGAMFIPGAFPAQPLEGSEKQLLDVYLIAVDDIPADFVAMAARRFIQGQVERKNIQFRPSPPELAVEARRLRDKALDAQRFDLARLPKPASADPPDPTPEERRQGAEMLRRVAREITATVAATAMPKSRRHQYRTPTREELVESRDRVMAADPAFAEAEEPAE